MARARAMLLPVLPMVVAGILLIGYGTRRTELACHRPDGTCTWRDGALGGSPHTFPMADIDEIRLVDNYGRHGDYGHVELRLRSGAVLAFGRGERAPAAARMTADARRFFSAEGTRLHFATPTLAWMGFLGGGLLLGALVIVLAVKRARAGNGLRALAVVAGLAGAGGSCATCALRDDPGLTVTSRSPAARQRAYQATIAGCAFTASCSRTSFGASARTVVGTWSSTPERNHFATM